MEYNLKTEGKFTYLEQGEGEVLLLLHGLFGALSNWKDVFEKFSSKYKVVIPMMPIFDLPILNTSVKGLAGFIDEFIEFKDYKNISMLGNSLGGHVALVYCAHFPNAKKRIHSLILTGSSGLYESAFGNSFPKRGDYEYIKNKVAVTFFDPAVANKELVDEVFEITNNRMKVMKIVAMAKTAIRHNMKDDLPSIKFKTCLIWGKNDIVTPPEVAEEFNQLMPNSELHWVDKCGHAPMMERPMEFNNLLDKFLESAYPIKAENN